MNRKKRWIVKNSQFNNKTEKFSISWSSSDSEDDKLTFKFPKKLKSDDNNSFPHEKQFCEQFLIEEESLFNNSTIENSPVLYGKVQLSPVIVKQSDLSLSPVIGKKSKLREIKRKIYGKNIPKRSGVTQDFECLSTKRGPVNKLWAGSPFKTSPDLFSSQDRFIIEVDNTQETPQSLEINDSSTEDIEKIDIEENSQICISKNTDDTVDISANSCSTNSSINAEPVLFYYKVPKKKRYKKGGFARKLQKTLQNQRMSVAIWKHEVYLSRERGCELEDDYLELKVIRKFQEYSCDFLECYIVKKNYKNVCDTSTNRTNKCLVLLNRNVQYEIGQNNLFLYFPFSTKRILYNSEYVDCYYNVCKIIS